MIPLPASAGPPPGTPSDCWNHIGVRGDRSCPLLPPVVHCQNCAVFSAAGRRFLDAPSPPGYGWSSGRATGDSSVKPMPCS